MVEMSIVSQFLPLMFVLVLFGDNDGINIVFFCIFFFCNSLFLYLNNHICLG